MDFSSSYAGLELVSPIVVGASPLALDAEFLKQVASYGAGAVVMPSIFEEQIQHADLQHLQSLQGSAMPPHDYPDMLTYRPQLDEYNGGAEGYLKHIEAAKQAVELPIIANVNCMTTGTWMKYVRRIEAAGADAIELNLYHYEVDPQRFADDIERELLERVHEFCSATKLGVSVKILPQFTALANIVFRFAGAGAKSVCLFGQSPSLAVDDNNRRSFQWGLTGNSDLRIRLEGIQIVRGAVHNLTLAACGGIQSPEDAIDVLRLGADVAMITSVVYGQGAQVVATLRDGVESYLKQRQMISVRELVGSESGGFDPYPNAYRRRGYTSAVTQAARRLSE